MKKNLVLITLMLCLAAASNAGAKSGQDDDDGDKAKPSEVDEHVKEKAKPTVAAKAGRDDEGEDEGDDDGEKVGRELVVVSEGCRLHHGASDSSGEEGGAEKGQRFVLKDTKLYNGFYKVENEGHISFIKAGDCEIRSVQPTPAPLTIKATPLPTPKPTLVPTKQTTKVPTEEPEEEPTDIPTAAPTKLPTKAPTLRPTAVPTDEPTEEPTAVPTKLPTKAPTLRPTAVPMEEPTDVPTAIPTKVATRIPTAWPTAAPTAVPTAIPTAVPSRATTGGTTVAVAGHGQRRTGNAPIPTPAPVNIHRGSVPRRTVLASSPPSAPGGGGQLGLPAGQGFGFAARDARQLPGFWLYMPLGAGKQRGSVMPAFKPDAGVENVRPIGSSAFVGLGVEKRLGLPWLRVSGDWTYFTHRTKAADQGVTATKVGLSPGGTVLFSDSDVYYQMNTHAFRVGLKASLPGTRVEPWVNGTLGAYVWSADYLDATRAWTYNGDAGATFGATVGLGVDFHFPNSVCVFTLTPFLEWGAPEVKPHVGNIAGLGQDWNDTYGTPVAAPSRFGLQLAIGY